MWEIIYFICIHTYKYAHMYVRTLKLRINLKKNWSRKLSQKASELIKFTHLDEILSFFLLGMKYFFPHYLFFSLFLLDLSFLFLALVALFLFLFSVFFLLFSTLFYSFVSLSLHSLCPKSFPLTLSSILSFHFLFLFLLFFTLSSPLLLLFSIFDRLWGNRTFGEGGVGNENLAFKIS